MTFSTLGDARASSSIDASARPLRSVHNYRAQKPFIGLKAAMVMVLLGASAVGYAQDASNAAVRNAKPIKQVQVMRPSSVVHDSSEVRTPFTQRMTARTNLTPVNTGSGVVYTCDANIDATVAGTCNYLNTTVASWYNDTFTNANASIYIQFGTTGLGESTTGFYNFLTYDQYVAALIANSNKSPAQTSALSALSSLAAGPYGGDSVEITSALGLALGKTGLNGTTVDGNLCSVPSAGCYNGIITVTNDTTTLYFDQNGGTEPNDVYDFYGVVAHETDEVLGTASCIDTQDGGVLKDPCDGAVGSGTGNPSAIDLYRYSSAGNLVLDASFDTTPGAYFSFDGGTTNGVKAAAGGAKDYNTLANGDDYADFVSSSPDCGTQIVVQDAEGCPGEDAGLSILNDGGGEIHMLNTVGYDIPASTTLSSQTALSASPTTITTSTPTILTATVSELSEPDVSKVVPTPSGTVNFMFGSTMVATCTLSSGTCQAAVDGSQLNLGNNSLIADYLGDTNYSSSNSSPVTVTVTGGATGPHVKFSQQVINFPSEKVGKATASMQQTLFNNGTATIHFSSITLTGHNTSSFSFTDNCGKTLAAGAHCTIKETFKPSKTGALTAAVTFTDDAPFDPQKIYLTGTGKK